MRAAILGFVACAWLLPACAGAVLEHSFLWMQTYDSPAHDVDLATAVAADLSGNIYVAGWSRRLDLGENDNILLIKYSPGGTILWTRTHNSFPDGADYGLGVAVAGDGSIYVVGAVDTPTNMLDGWIRKYSPDGEVVTTFGSGGTVTYNSSANDQDVFYDVAVAGDGSVYVAGIEFRGDLGEQGNWLVVKYSNVGSPLWTRTHNGVASLWDEALALDVAPNGDVVVAGYETLADPTGNIAKGLLSRRYGAKFLAYSFGPPPGLNTDIVVRWYDPDGILKWKVSYGSDTFKTDGSPVHIAQDVANGVAVDGSGDVYVTATIAPLAPLNSWFDHWIRKYSADGHQVLWTRRIEGGDFTADFSGRCDVNSAPPSTGRLFMAGTSSRFDIAQAENLMVALYDQGTGLPLRTQVYDGGNYPAALHEFGEDIAVDSEGNYTVVGWGQTQVALNQGIIWIIRKYAGPPIIPADLSNLKVYPNPFRPASAVGGVLKFGNLPPAAVVRIYTARGYLVRELRAPFEWDGLNDRGVSVATGVYFYVVKEGGKAPVRGKVVLVR